MPYDISCKIAGPRTLAAARRLVPMGGVAAAFKPALDEVWAFLKDRRDLKPGHNVFLYQHPSRPGEPMVVDFGVEVEGDVAEAGPVHPASTPAGEVVRVMHTGPYSGIAAAHQAIHTWRAENNRQFAGWSWEIYGDWNDDQSKLETEIMYLLRP